MSGPPPPVTLDDLASPRFSPEVTRLLGDLEAVAPTCPLDPGHLLAAASDETALADYGDQDFVGRLELLCRALRSEAGLSGAGVVTWYSQLLQFLKNRLLIQDLLSRHPEIHEIEIKAPLIICGLPRTGTTHLHNLISADPTWRSLPYWESLEPVLDPSEVPGPGEEDPRRVRTAFALEMQDAVLPYFKRMHEMTVDHVHEEIQLLGIDLSSMLFETLAPLPSWRDHYRATDQTPSYEYLRTVLKVLQWLRGGERWVLKSPQHLEQFGPLRATFPDATFVVTHRDPVAITTSVATMIAYASRLLLRTVDPRAIGDYWSARIEDLFVACTKDRELLAPERSIDVRFDEFMADDVAMVERIYEVADQPMTDDARSAMVTFMADHPRGRHGTVNYLPEAVGVDPDERRAGLAFYAERFAVAREG